MEILQKAGIKQVAVILFVLFASTTVAQTFHENVPYQDSDLLENPLPGTMITAQDAYLDCNWQTLMDMIRDLEERIATENGADTTYDVYFTGEVVGNSIYMHYDCLVLRDSVLSLQQQLDDAIQPEVPSFSGISFNGATDSLVAVIADNGGSALSSFTFEYSANADLSSSTTGAEAIGDATIRLYFANSGGHTYYGAAAATNDVGTAYSDTISWSTLADVSAATESVHGSSAVVSASFVFDEAAPS